MTVKFTERDQIQYLESQLTLIRNSKSSPLKQKRIAIMEDVIDKLRRIYQANYPDIIYYARTIEIDLEGPEPTAIPKAWLMAISLEDFKKAESIILGRGRSTRYFRLDRDEPSAIMPKLEFWHAYPKILVDGWSRVSPSTVNAYVEGVVEGEDLNDYGD